MLGGTVAPAWSAVTLPVSGPRAGDIFQQCALSGDSVSARNRNLEILCCTDIYCVFCLDGGSGITDCYVTGEHGRLLDPILHDSGGRMTTPPRLLN